VDFLDIGSLKKETSVDFRFMTELKKSAEALKMSSTTEGDSSFIGRPRGLNPDDRHQDGGGKWALSRRTSTYGFSNGSDRLYSQPRQWSPRKGNVV
jgi:hypothetical protein